MANARSHDSSHPRHERPRLSKSESDGFLLPHCGLRLGDALDGFEARVPSGCDPCHRANRDVKVFRPHGVADLAALTRALHEAGAVEHREVLGDRLPGERQVRGELGGRDLAVREQEVEHLAARGVGDRFEQRLLAGRARAHLAAFGAYSRTRSMKTSQPFEWSSAYFALTSSDHSTWSKPLSTTRRRVRPFSSWSVNSTSIELLGRAVITFSWSHR